MYFFAQIVIDLGIGVMDKKPEEPQTLHEFRTWLLELPPINLYNVELVYLAFGYRNARSELDTRYDLSAVSTTEENNHEYDPTGL